MSAMNRRALLLGSTALVAAPLLSSCSGVSVTPAQLLADANAMEAGLVKAWPLIIHYMPNLLPVTGPPGTVSQASITNAAGTGWLDLAGALLAGLSPTTPAAQSATTLATVENYFNLFLNATAAITPALAQSIPGIGPAVAAIDAATVLLPIIEQFVASTAVPALAAHPAARRVAARAPRVTPLHVSAARGLAPLAGGVPRVMTVEDARAILGVPTL